MADYRCKCSGCKYIDPNERSSYKWYCTWYRSYEDPDIVRECRHFESQSGSSSCFLTSACCQHKGLPDNCDELMALRNFRDFHLMETEEGRQLVDEYRQIAPGIVEKINQSPDRDRIYDGMYAAICAIKAMIDRGEYQSAVEHYRTMVLDCKNRLV